MEALRGKTNDSNNEKIDYSFNVEDDRITISERRRGSPIDKVVSELMIYVNTNGASNWLTAVSPASIAARVAARSG